MFSGNGKLLKAFPNFLQAFLRPNYNFCRHFWSNFAHRKIACVIDLKWNQPHSIFGRLLQKLFWRAPYFQSIIQKAKTKLFIFIGEWKRGAKRARALRGPPFGGPPPLSIPQWKWKFCFWFLNDALNVGCAPKSFWNDLPKMECVWFHFKPVPHAILQIWRFIKLL